MNAENNPGANELSAIHERVDGGDLLRTSTRIALGEQITVSARFVRQLTLKETPEDPEQNRYVRNFNRDFSGVPEAYEYALEGRAELVYDLACSMVMRIFDESSLSVSYNNAVLRGTSWYRLEWETLDRFLDHTELEAAHKKCRKAYQPLRNRLANDGSVLIKGKKYEENDILLSIRHLGNRARLVIAAGKPCEDYTTPEKSPLPTGFSFWLDAMKLDLEPHLTADQLNHIFGKNSVALEGAPEVAVWLGLESFDEPNGKFTIPLSGHAKEN